ncbi:hypothetical protein AGRA3207_005182 [Actinomadura graeca]|uniref:DUF4352 domain-containing protein n=1 Tax=Actinomadura graeca TaxID=2750812 RepID=A0ABX8R4L4_9ACTN|nr:hypothetical protein [Actinomadura graeca]QXJ23948.1 hypothetical protein AGRA3207_005182 [Actinomadura graeca]
MQSTAPVPPASGGRAPRRRLVSACVLCAAAVTAAVLWAAGGFEETPRQPAGAPGKAVDLGLFTVVVRDARIGVAAGDFGTGRQRFLIVRLRVLNRGEETASLGIGGLSDGVAARTRTGKWVKPDQVEGTAGGSKTDTTQPGLPVEASAMWKMGPADAPRQFTVGLRKWEYGHGFTDTSFRWRIDLEDDALAARLTLPVTAVAAPATPRPTRHATPKARPRFTPRVRPRSTPKPTAGRR